MSYGFMLSFMRAEDKTEAFLKAEQFASMLVNSPLAHLRNNLRYFRRIAGVNNGTEMQSKDTRLLKYWLNSLFLVLCTYWPQHKLVAISGEKWPNNCKDLIEGSVLFQNGTDQDYSLEEWPATIPFFQERIAQVQRMSDDEVLNASDFYYEDDKENVGYARRNLLYSRIFQDLELDKWLYGGEGAFQRFAMSGITNWYMNQDLYSKALSLMYKI